MVRYSERVVVSLERFARGRWYIAFVMGTWILAPEVRRLVDWRSTFHSLSILSILPLLSLLPGIFLLRKDWSGLGDGFRHSSRFWLIGFAYASLIALAHFSIFSGAYSLVEFCLPVGFGAALLASRDGDILLAYRRLADATVVFVAVASVYGIIQYVSPPPWDVYWAQQADIEGSQGLTVAYGFRIFGTLNSTGPMANAAMVSILLNLPRLSLRRWYVLISLVPTIAALALTQVRSAWLGVAVGLVCYVLLCARRARALAWLTATIVLVAVIGMVVASHSTDFAESIATLSDRVNTLGALGYDQSSSERQEETHDAFSAALSEPLGLGLGAFGVAAKLSVGSLVNLDSGYMARLLEMGAFGFLFFVTSLLAALIYSFRAVTRARRNRDPDAVDVLAAGISLQVVLLFFETGADTHLSMLGMFFWASVAFASQYEARSSRLGKDRASNSRDRVMAGPRKILYPG